MYEKYAFIAGGMVACATRPVSGKVPPMVTVRAVTPALAADVALDAR
jgi:hypothetical protein